MQTLPVSCVTLLFAANALWTLGFLSLPALLTPAEASPQFRFTFSNGEVQQTSDQQSNGAHLSSHQWQLKKTTTIH